jgi:hypothetical protein
MIILIGKQGKFFKEHFIPQNIIKASSEMTPQILRIELREKKLEEKMMWIARFAGVEFAVWYCDVSGGEWLDNQTYLSSVVREMDLIPGPCDHDGHH